MYPQHNNKKQKLKRPQARDHMVYISGYVWKPQNWEDRGKKNVYILSQLFRQKMNAAFLWTFVFHSCSQMIVRCGKPSGPPKPLGKEQSHCSFRATALREIATIQEDSCWTPLFSLCMGPGRLSTKSMMFHTWARSHSNVTANPSTEVKGNLGMTMYSFLFFCTA
jgi:hypothetical protein